VTYLSSAGPDTDPAGVSARLEARIGALRAAKPPLWDPHPTAEARIASALPPEQFERSVAQAVRRIRAGELEKVVLAREVVVEAPQAHDPAALYGALRELFPSCFCFCVGSPEAAFLGASPELLVRRRGAGVATVALRRATLFQILGIVLVENALALAALELPGGASLAIELGVALDLVLIALVAGVFHERIFAEFGAGDTAALRTLRD